MGLLLALALAVSPSARHEAEQLYQSARADEAAGSVKMALTEATHAFALDPKPAYLLEIAQCQKTLGRWSEAAAAYQRYLAYPQVKNRAAAKQSLAEVQSHLSNAPAAGPLAIAPLVASPLVAAPAAPPPTAAPATTAAGPTPVATAPPVQASSKPEPPPSAPVAAVTDSPAALSGEVSSDQTSGHTRVWAYTLIGVAVAAAAFGAVGWVNVASYNGYVSSVASGQVTSSGLSAQQNLSSAQTWQIVAISTTIGTVLAAGGAALTW
jgi:hypothetical protein